MKKGKSLNIFVGLLDILFALALAAVLVVSFALDVDLIEKIIGEMILTFLALLSKSGLTILNQIESLTYVFVGLVGLISLFSLISGVITIAKSRKTPEKYYKRGGFIAFALFETIGLAFFVALLVIAPLTGAIATVSALGFIVLLRYVGLMVLSCGRKKYLSEMPVA